MDTINQINEKEILDQINSFIKKNATFYISHSGGKDSQAMYSILNEMIPYDQIVVIHASLGEIEWAGIIDHIRNNIEHPLNIVQANKTFFEMVENRKMFPSSRYRQCTSDLKRNPIEKFIRNNMKNRKNNIAINCMGLRAEESSGRAKKEVLKLKKSLTVAGRTVYDWLPIHKFTTEEVFQTIRNAGQEPFWAYKLGNQRLSCVFCIMGSKNDLRNGAKQNPKLFKKYIELEKKIGHTMFLDKGTPILINEYIG